MNDKTSGDELVKVVVSSAFAVSRRIQSVADLRAGARTTDNRSLDLLIAIDALRKDMDILIDATGRLDDLAREICAADDGRAN